MIDINISHNLDIMLGDLISLRKRDLPTVIRQSMNKTISNVQTKSSFELRQQVNLRAREIKQSYFDLRKARGSKIPALEASLKISSKPISLIRFARTRDVERQGFKAVNKRRKVRYAIKKGSTKTRRNLFVLKGKSGNVHMFSRTTTKSNPVLKQSVPSLSHYFKSAGIEPIVKRHAQDRFRINFTAAMNNKLRARGLK